MIFFSSVMEIVQTFALAGFCLPLVEFLTFFWAGILSCAWAEVTFS